jgi:alanine dehydrogenase
VRPIISDSDVLGDLFDLASGSITVDRKPDDITLFKSAGTAIEDLAAAMLAYKRLEG